MWKPCRDTTSHIGLVSKGQVRLINPMPLLSLAEYRVKCYFSHKVTVTSSCGNILRRFSNDWLGFSHILNCDDLFWTQTASECVSSIHVIMESVRYIMFQVIFNQQMYLVAVPGSCFEIPSETPVELLFFSIAHAQFLFFFQIYSWPWLFSNEHVDFKGDFYLLKRREHSLNCIISQIKCNYQLRNHPPLIKW